jgi:hypothetical protein
MAVNKQVAHKVLQITGSFEGGEQFANLTGNFDKQGLSFGILQWNFGQKSLQPLLLKMKELDETRMKDILGLPFYKQLMDVVEHGSFDDQMRFARSINDSRANIIQPWRSKLKELGRDEKLQEAQTWAAGGVMARAEQMCAKYSLKEELSLSLMFDIRTQNGSIKKKCEPEIDSLIRKIPGNAKTGGKYEEEVRKIIAKTVANSSKREYVADVMSRKMTCAVGAGVVHGRKFNLFRDFGIVAGAAFDRPDADTKAPVPLKTVLLPSNKLVACNATWDGKKVLCDAGALLADVGAPAPADPFMRVDMKSTLDKLGWEALTHMLESQKKVYVRMKQS